MVKVVGTESSRLLFILCRYLVRDQVLNPSSPYFWNYAIVTFGLICPNQFYFWSFAYAGAVSPCVDMIFYIQTYGKMANEWKSLRDRAILITRPRVKRPLRRIIMTQSWCNCLTQQIRQYHLV